MILVDICSLNQELFYGVLVPLLVQYTVVKCLSYKILNNILKLTVILYKYKSLLIMEAIPLRFRSCSNIIVLV